MEREIKFFVNTQWHREAVSAVANEASTRGYDVSFTENYSETAEVGFYVDHIHRINNINSNISIVMLHGLDDAYKSDHWLDEPWYRFDVGLLPGSIAAENWRSQSWHPKTIPKYGVFDVGWPKFDVLYDNSRDKRIDNIRSEIGLSEGFSMMYAPHAITSRYNNSKVYDENVLRFIENSEALVDNLLVRHTPTDNIDYSDEFYDKVRNHSDVFIMDSEMEIMDCLGLADILLTDGSSVIYESLLTDTVPMVVADWRSDKIKSAEASFPEFVSVTSFNSFEKDVIEIKDNFEKKNEYLNTCRADHFSHLGNSSVFILDLIDELISGADISEDPIEPIDNHDLNIYGSLFAMPYERLRNKVVFSMSNKTKGRLREYKIDKFVEKIDSAVKRS